MTTITTRSINTDHDVASTSDEQVSDTFVGDEHHPEIMTANQSDAEEEEEMGEALSFDGDDFQCFPPSKIIEHDDDEEFWTKQQQQQQDQPRVPPSTSSLTDSDISYTTDMDGDGEWRELYASPKHLPLSDIHNVVDDKDDDVGFETLVVPLSLPYAQLCFDPNTKSLVTLVEIILSHGTDCEPKAKRLRLLDYHEKETDDLEQEWNKKETKSSSGGSTQGMNSSFSWSSSSSTSSASSPWDTPASATWEETMVLLGTPGAFKNQDLMNAYRLPHRNDPWDESEGKGTTCTDSLKRILRQLLLLSSSRDWQAMDGPPVMVSYQTLTEVE